MSPPDKGRLVVVSNRVAPIRQKGSGAQGGLAVAVHAALRSRGGVWFGWSGQAVEGEPGPPSSFEAGDLTYATLDLSRRDYEEYYNGFANRTLWPLFHYRLDLADFNRRNFIGYQRVNHLFASQLRPLLRDDDVIWVHDYHLIPMAEQLREAGCKQRIGFFLHIPWPALEVLLALPTHRHLVRALCSYDLIGFQIQDHADAFLDYIRREVEGTVRKDGTAKAFGRKFKVGAFPIGIDTETVERFAKEAEHSRQSQRLRDSLRSPDLIIGVDRLDYSKGLVHRMESFEQLLRSYPANRGRVTLLQIAPPSRTDVPEYMEIRRDLEAMAGHVNGSYAEFDWVPIRYLNKGFKRQTLTGFFRMARVGLVTPLRDGMNLVAKEYVAAQRPTDPGVLVLSRFAGAAHELHDGAVLVNPYDTEGTAEVLQLALAMPMEERRERWHGMIAHLRKANVDAWCAEFLKALIGPPKA